MKEIGTTPLTSGSISDQRWSLAQRVADSACFRKGPKLRAFLLYVCENTLLGRLDNVREQLIGSKVFGRRPEYSFSEDNIVRVEARELRKRLETYFAGEGHNEPILIEIPKGGYVPVFRARGDAESGLAEPKSGAAVEPVSQTTVSETAAPAPPPRVEAPSSRRLILFLIAGLTVAAALVVLLSLQNARLRQPSVYLRGAQPGAAAEDYSFYGEMLGNLGKRPDRETLLVLSNPKAAYVGDILSNGEVDSRPLASRDDSNVYTGIGEATAAFHVGQLMQFLRRPVRLTQGRFLNWDHLQKLDIILLGGPRASQWTYDNLPPSNFSFENGTVVNAKPLPGEQKVYGEPGTEWNAAMRDFGVIKMLVSPYGFNTLLLAGGSGPGTAGVGEFFSNPEKMRDVYKRLRAASPSSKSFPSNWEVLLRIDVRDALPVETSIVTVRTASTNTNQ